MQFLSPDLKLGPVLDNIATLLKLNAEKFRQRLVFQHRVGDRYQGISWV